MTIVFLGPYVLSHELPEKSHGMPRLSRLTRCILAARGC